MLESCRREGSDRSNPGKGTGEDVAWLAALPNHDALAPARAEAAAVDKKIADLESGLNDDLPVDRLVMDDGRTLDCRILETTATDIIIERKLSGGVGGKMTFKHAQVKAVQKGKGAGSEFATKLAAAKTAGPAALVTLADWCKEQGFAKQRDHAL
jgi:hypothetical protein